MQTQIHISCNGHSMVDPLKRVLVCSPAAAGWDTPTRAARWQELGFQHPVDARAAAEQHAALCRELQCAGAELVSLPASPHLSLDGVYAHDASLATDFGVVILRPGKDNRVVESAWHRNFYQGIGVPVLGELTSPAMAEAGDMIWLDSRTLLIGRGYRTNDAGIDQMRKLLAPKGVQVFAAPLPHGTGPSACLHLMSLVSLIDEHMALVDLPWLAVETVELLRAKGFGFVEIDQQERETLACNVLALGDRQLLALEENVHTNQRLRANGFRLRTFAGRELCINGSGGPTCLTRPLLRG